MRRRPATQIRTELDTNSTKLANLDVTVSSRSTLTANDVWASGTRTLSGFSFPATVSTNNDKTGYSLSTTPPTAAQIRSEIDTNSTKLDVAVSTRLASASYSSAPTAVQIRTEIDNNSTKLANLDQPVSSRLASASYSAPDNTGIAEIKAQTDKLQFTGTDVKATLDGESVSVSDKTGFSLTTAEHTNIADALLKRDWSQVTGEAARSVINALRAIRNKVTRSGSTLTVTKEDDTTSAWTASVQTDGNALPVTGVDPE